MFKIETYSCGCVIEYAYDEIDNEWYVVMEDKCNKYDCTY